MRAFIEPYESHNRALKPLREFCATHICRKDVIRLEDATLDSTSHFFTIFCLSRGPKILTSVLTERLCSVNLEQCTNITIRRYDMHTKETGKNTGFKQGRDDAKTNAHAQSKSRRIASHNPL